MGRCSVTPGPVESAPMKPRQRNRRIAIIGGATVLLAMSAWLVTSALERSISYYYTPSEAIAAGVTGEVRVRLGGLVEDGSVQPLNTGGTSFNITDGAHSIGVVYQGILPDLFREGQGVIAQGAFRDDNNFVAESILAKHDENYVPRELQGTIADSNSNPGT